MVTPGKDLSNVQLQVLVANGDLTNFANDVKRDCRKPMPISMNGYDGSVINTKLHLLSAPTLASFIIKGLTIPAEDIHESSTSYIIQVPEDTDLTKLEVTMEFNNGTLQNFTNGEVKDYTDVHHFSILGVDEETVYNYELMITTEPVGPAYIKGMKVNGVTTDKVETVNGKLIPYIPSLIDFSNVDVELEVGYANKIDESFTGKGLNLLLGNNKVTVTGTDGIPMEFVIGVPQLSFQPIVKKNYADLGFGGNDLCSVGFSGGYIVAGHYTSTDKTPDYFDFNGEKVGSLSKEGANPTGYGFRKFAVDEKGAVLAMSLGMSGGEQWIYKWDNVTAAPTEYISFSKTSLGVDYNPRSGGINIEGALDGNATITLTIAQKQDAFVWTVTNGVLNSTPKKVSFPYAGASYYWALVPMPAGVDGYLGMVTNNSVENAGVIRLSGTLTESFRASGFYATDGKVIKHNGRVYLAYTAHSNNKGIMRICDITEDQKESYAAPIFEQVMEVEGANGNATMDAELAVIDGKLCVAFACTNLGLYVYQFDK